MYSHIFTRGNDKKKIFIDDYDCEYFLGKLIEYSRECQMSIICYALMPNHLHFIIRQNADIVVSTFMHKLSGSYAMYFNKRYVHVGHVFQGRFKSKTVKDDDYLLHLSRYIHLNPLDIAGSMNGLERYLWSSYAEYVRSPRLIQQRIKPICDKTAILDLMDPLAPDKDYRSFIEDAASKISSGSGQETYPQAVRDSLWKSLAKGGVL